MVDFLAYEFLDSSLLEILKVLLLIEEEKIQIDNYGVAFTIAFELAKFDDIANLFAPERESYFYETMNYTL